jgi:hypothetical protein
VLHAIEFQLQSTVAKPTIFSNGLWIAMVVVWKQFHQTTKQVHDCHHEEHSLPMFGLLFMTLFDDIQSVAGYLCIISSIVF